MKRNFLLSAAIAASLLAACGQQGKETATVAKAPVYDQTTAQAFLAEAEAELMDAAEYASRASWLAATYINDDSQFVEAKSAKDYTLAVVKYAKQVKKLGRRPAGSGDPAQAGCPAPGAQFSLARR